MNVLEDHLEIASSRAPAIIDTRAGPPNQCLPIVLVVEDEPLLRMLAVEIVEDAGFVALAAADADEAIEILEARSDICLVFTDINMPGQIDGLQLAHAIHDRWPPVKLVVVSGQMRPCQADLPLRALFVEKPYQMATMINLLRSLIELPAPAVANTAIG